MSDELTVQLPLAQALDIADTWQQGGRAAEAADLLDRILAAAPRHPAALHLRGLVAFRLGDPADAARRIEQAVVEGGPEPVYLRNLCSIYERLGRYPDAVAAGERAAALDPLDAGALHNLAVVHYRRLDLDAAMKYARAAIAIDPSAPGPHFAMAEALLVQGQFAEGWEEYEWRFRMPGVASPLPSNGRPDWGRPEWDGAPMPRGRLLLVADQGFGDAIQFCRYIPWVAEHCAELAFACSAELRPLLAQVAPGVPMFNRWDEAPDFAAWCTLSGLPRRHRTRLETIPGAPYLRSDPVRFSAWRARLAAWLPPGRLRVGLVWAGRSTHANDGNRSASMAAMAPLAALPGLVLVALQKGPAQAQVGAYHGGAPLLALGPEIADFADTAAILTCLDVLVTVDTSLAHLAGALGVPAWILLPYAPDWRWLLGRPDSPWYPSLRLFRQPAPHDWAPVAAQVAAALSEYAATSATPGNDDTRR